MSHVPTLTGPYLIAMNLRSFAILMQFWQLSPLILKAQLGQHISGLHCRGALNYIKPPTLNSSLVWGMHFKAGLLLPYPKSPYRASSPPSQEPSRSPQVWLLPMAPTWSTKKLKPAHHTKCKHQLFPLLPSHSTCQLTNSTCSPPLQKWVS